MRLFRSSPDEARVPGAVTGEEPFEQHGRELSAALRRRDEPSTREAIQRLLHCEPTSCVIRYMAAIAYEQLGSPAEAMVELGIGLALEPGNYSLRAEMARLLLQRGEDAAARVVLEKGWIQRRQDLPRRAWRAEKQSYFAVLEEGRSAGGPNAAAAGQPPHG